MIMQHALCPRLASSHQWWQDKREERSVPDDKRLAGVVLHLSQAPDLLPIDLLPRPFAERQQLPITQLHRAIQEHFGRHRGFAGQQIESLQIAEQSKVAMPARREQAAPK